MHGVVRIRLLAAMQGQGGFTWPVCPGIRRPEVAGRKTHVAADRLDWWWNRSRNGRCARLLVLVRMVRVHPETGFFRAVRGASMVRPGQTRDERSGRAVAR